MMMAGRHFFKVNIIITSDKVTSNGPLWSQTSTFQIILFTSV